MKSPSEDWSEDAPTIVEPSRNSIRREVELMIEAMKKASVGKDQAVIGVVRPDALALLEQKCKPAWYKRLIGKKSEDYPFLVTTDQELQEAIATLRNRKFRHCQELSILGSAKVDALSPFAVGSQFKILRISRCGHDKDPKGRLLIAGHSTFNKICLDEWQQDEQIGRELWIGQGVGMGVDPKWRSSAANGAINLDRDQQAELKSHLQTMRKGNMHRNWWKRWRGPIAAILGIVTTTGKIAVGLKVAAGGAFVDFNCAAFSLKAGIAGLKASSVMTVAGPAVLLGVGVAAAVYFIPWDDVISWIGSLFSRFCSWIMRLWEDFQTWWHQGQVDRTARSSKKRSRPMQFH